MLEAVVHGFLLALGLILPLGAQNIFVFNQGAAHRRFSNYMPVVLTASLCDTLLILLAVLGVSLIVFTFAWVKLVVFIVGFLFLLYMGWAIWNSDPASNQQSHAGMGKRQQILFSMSVSLLNPHAILDTVGVIGTSSLNYSGGTKVAFGVTCILVSWIWFFGLAAAGHIAGKADPGGTWIKLLNKLSAIIIWSVALYIGWQLAATL